MSTDPWKVIAAFFDEHGFVAAQIEPFDEFLEKGLQDIVDENRDISVVASRPSPLGTAQLKRYSVHMGQVTIGRPTHAETDGEIRPLFPSEARLRNLTYAAPVYVATKMTVETQIASESPDEGDAEPCRWLTEETTVQKKPLLIGRVPVMVKSAFCHLKGLTDDEIIRKGESPYDTGGYFVVSGTERVLIAQEKLAANHPFVFRKGPTAYTLEFRSQDDRSSRTPSNISLRLVMGRVDRINSVKVTMPYIRTEIPIAVVFRALGCSSDEEIVRTVGADAELRALPFRELLLASLEDCDGVYSTEEALEYIGRRGSVVSTAPRQKKIKYGQDLIRREFLPHMGISDGDLLNKAMFLGDLLKRLLNVTLGNAPPDDRDHAARKRVDTSGMLLASLFKTHYRRLLADLSKLLKKSIESNRDFDVIASVKDPSIITRGFQSSLGTGNWTDPGKLTPSRVGISQVLNRYSYAASLSHLRRLQAPTLARDSKMTKPRQLHSTQWGFICPAETPEGPECGLVKNLALTASITRGGPPWPVLYALKALSVREELEADGKATKIYVNGRWVGMYDEPKKLLDHLRGLRRTLQLDPETGLHYDICKNEVRVRTDAGRLCRPLFVLYDGKVKQTDQPEPSWTDLLANGVVEYVDVDEEETTLIGMTYKELEENPDYTHCEIHPSTILGVSASHVPFPDRNQSPRNTYQSAMGKQSMGVFAINYQERMDSMSNALFYPQRPLSATRTMDHLGSHHHPAGQNAIVAIASHTGYNQEDSLIMNQSAIDRGLFRSLYYRLYMDVEKRSVVGDGEVMGKDGYDRLDLPPMQKNVEAAKAMDRDGIVPPGTKVKLGDPLIGKTVGERNQSTYLKGMDNGVVDKVMITTNNEGYTFVKTRIRSIRIPEIGDKFASRHGQKGTVGLTLRQEDMPASAEGITPDIIINPHAVPSRMTIGHLVECLQSKVGALTGTFGDSTPFTDLTVNSISDDLKALGYQGRGYEVMYNGATGRKMRAQVFLGPTYYQRLKHLVQDKVHSRARGPVQTLTRQPVEGRARDGGLRFGEMERDCIISHGAMGFLRERMFDLSDPYRIHVCSECGFLADVNLDQQDVTKQRYRCNVCLSKDRDSSYEIRQVHIPYAAHLLFAELKAMSICVRIIT